MKHRCSEIMADLEKGMAETITFFEALSPQQLETPVYTDNVQWTARQILAHLVTIERSMQWLFKDIVAGGSGSPPDFDLDRFNNTQVKKLDGLSPADLMERLTQVRKKTIDIVDRMAETDLDREGRHAFHGHGKLERFIRWTQEHADLHMADIRRAIDQA